MEHNFLMHHGTKGMKWGRRRYQNKDGSLTAAGKKRYGDKEDVHDDYTKAHTKRSIKAMSDSELQSRNRRLNMEKQYKELTSSKSAMQKGKKVVNTIISTAGTIAAAQGAYVTYKKIFDGVMKLIGNNKIIKP